jgi:hypothetical protein
MADFNAKNNFKLTRFAFYERLKYKLEAFRNTPHTNVKTFKIGELTHYGLIDLDYYTIEPKQNVLKYDSGNKSALNFVTDAFQGVVNHFNTAVSLEKINLNDRILSRISNKKSYENPQMLYDMYMNDLMNTYIDTYLDHTKIKNIDDFADNLIPYMKKMKSSFPLNYSSWIKSTRSTPFMSGLYIDVLNLQMDNDTDKTNKILNNPNLDFFIDTCKSHGFYIYDQFPSVLVADISSEPMRRYMQPYYTSTGTANERFFTTFYDRAHKRDLDLLTDNIVKFYNIFLSKYPYINNIKITKLNETYVDLFYREKNIINNININKLINIYTNIKNIEEDYPFGDSDIAEFIKNAIKIKNNLDKSDPIDYINLQFATIYKNKYGNINFYKEKFKSLED